MTEYKCKVYLIPPQVGWHGFSLVAAIDANYANDIIRKAAGESRYYWGYSRVNENDAIANVYSDTIGFVYEGIFEDDEYSRID